MDAPLLSFLERNMNDYLIHYNHNHDALGRFARSAGSASSAVGSRLTSRKKEKNNSIRKYESNQRLASKKNKDNKVEKKKGSKSNNTKLSDSERKRLVESASLKEVTANKDRLSNRELESAISRLQKEKINRIDLEKKLYDLNKPDSQKNKESAIQKIERLGNNAEKLANAINSGTKLYNNAVQVYNLGKPESQRLPRIGNNNDGKKTRPWVQAIIDSGDAAKAAKYASQMTAEERSKVSSSIKVMNTIRNTASQESNSSNTSSNKTSESPDYKSFFNEKQQNRPESWADVRNQTSNNNRTEEILKDYPENKSGESQKMTDEEIKKKYKR